MTTNKTAETATATAAIVNIEPAMARTVGKERMALAISLLESKEAAEKDEAKRLSNLADAFLNGDKDKICLLAKNSDVRNNSGTCMRQGTKVAYRWSGGVIIFATKEKVIASKSCSLALLATKHDLDVSKFLGAIKSTSIVSDKDASKEFSSAMAELIRKEAVALASTATAKSDAGKASQFAAVEVAAKVTGSAARRLRKHHEFQGGKSMGKYCPTLTPEEKKSLTLAKKGQVSKGKEVSAE